MPSDPTREARIKPLIGQLRGVAVVEAQRLIAKWLAEERISRQELVALLNSYERAVLLGAPTPPFHNYIGRLGLMTSAEGQARLADWERAAADWRRQYLTAKGDV